ncbi:MAG: recombinase family protein, partial [Pseudomonadota bacterium]
MISDSTTNGTKPNIETCVLYARVSSHKQVEEGSGLSSQITRCKDFARSKGFATLDIFMDEGVSGGELERRGMDGLIAFLEDNASADAPIAVVVDDISRLARGVATHETIRNRIYKAHGVLFSPSQRFGRDADSRMVEMMQATVAEHFKNKNAETTRARLKARWMGGYYTASPPCGYKYDRVEGHGKMLLPDEPAASIIAEAFEGLASGRFQTATEVARWLETHPTFPRP